MAARYGLIGLAVMGENLALNIEQHGFPIAVYNRTAERTRRFAEGEAQGKQITPTYSIAEFVGALDDVLPVDIRIPGCPPTPDAIAGHLLAWLDGTATTG